MTASGASCRSCGGVIVWAQGVLVCSRPACETRKVDTPMSDSARKPTIAARLNRVLGQLLLLADAGAIDQTRVRVNRGSGGHGTHKGRGMAPEGAFATLEERSPVVQWSARFDRMLAIAERELTEAQSGRAASPARKRAEDRTILKDYVGVDPTAVAYIFGRTTAAVRKLRSRNGRAPDTGERASRDVLTTRGVGAA